ncbi:MAG: hypothetical protein VX427_00445, partial [Acidobacteriota bacterium]|nr:hypothetical protein [Acidobacteriota bacterium]
MSEVPVPFVVARDGRALHPTDLLPFVAQRLPRIYRPDIRLVAGLPETSVGKVARRAVRDTFLRTDSGRWPRRPSVDAPQGRIGGMPSAHDLGETGFTSRKRGGDSFEIRIQLAEPRDDLRH